MEVRSNWLQELLDGEKKHVYSDSGEREAVTYAPVYDQKGVWHLEESGKENRYLDIQSHADSCDINVIMARYEHGETDVLSRVQGVYGDVSQLPTNYAEFMNAQLKARQLFDGLAPEIREKYNNSVEQFMASLGTKEGLEAIGFKFEEPVSPDPDLNEEVKTDA